MRFAVRPIPFSAPTAGLRGHLLLEGPRFLFQGSGSLFVSDETRAEVFETLIYPIKRGIFLEPISVRLPAPPCTVILPADAVSTDLSQFCVRESELAELSERACLLIEEGLELLCRYKGSPPPLLNPIG